MDRINRIGAERVKDVARRIFDAGTISLAGIGPVAKLPDYQTISDRLRN